MPLMVEPGLDEHEWRTRWEQLDEVAHEAPYEAAGGMDRLVREMLDERGIEDGNDEAAKQYQAAHELYLAYETAVERDPGDLAEAINGFRAVYEFVVSEYEAP
jgi:hypothetical protein